MATKMEDDDNNRKEFIDDFELDEDAETNEEEEDEEEEEEEYLLEGDAEDEANLVSQPLSYRNTKQSLYYVKAKSLLSDGNFEAALSLLMKGMQVLLRTISEQSGARHQDDTSETHPAMAPFYYLYGTTLLYSVEEGGKDGNNAESQVMNSNQEDEDEGGQHDANNVTFSNEDLQIAWENLELARSILSKFNNGKLDVDQTVGSKTSESADDSYELEADMAQIHLRLGDLSRHNGHYLDAVNEYEQSCRLRRKISSNLSQTQSLSSQEIMRKIADVEYLLGMTSMLVAAEGDKNLQDPSPETDEDIDKIRLSPSQIRQYREKSTAHYVECAKMLSYNLASICQIDLDKWKSTMDSLTISSYPHPLTTMSSINTAASSILREIRKQVSLFPKCTDTDDASVVLELGELLDEIQETIDSADADSAGLQDVVRMKKMAVEAASIANVDDDDDDDKQQNGFGITTQIGFDSKLSGSTNESLSNKISDSSGANGTMMIIKKKKKRVEANAEDTTENEEKKMKASI